MPPEDDVLLPIQKGKKISEYDLKIQSDCEVNGQPCETIVDPDWDFCECCVLYWAWKNIKKVFPDLKYIGLFHYRRFLSFDDYEPLISIFGRNDNDISNYKISSSAKRNIKKYLDDGCVITAEPVIFPISLRLQFNDSCMSKDYKILKDVIEKFYPDYYDSFIEIMEENNKFIPCNIFVMRYEDFCEYCEWLFKVLEIVRPQIDTRDYDSYQKRLPGFMAERLFYVWLRKNNKPLKFRNMYLYGAECNYKTRSTLRKIFAFMKNLKHAVKINFAFRLTRMSFFKALLKIFSIYR